MRRLRKLPRRRVYAIAASVAVLAATGGIAQGALKGSDPKPAPKPLATAVLDALRAPKLEGISARVHFTNNLFPAGTLPAGTSSPLAAGADGRLWLAGDGRFRIDLRSDAGGDAQIVSDGKQLTIYDGPSKTLYALPLPHSLRGGDRGAGATRFPLQGIQSGLGNLLRAFTISDAKPSSTAGRPTYTVRIAPRDDGGLLGAAEVAWDAERGVPLRLAVYAQGDSDPTLELKATEVSYGPVPGDRLAATPHPGAHRVSIDAADVRAGGRLANVTGVDAVQRRLDFPLAAPKEVAGLTRGQVRLFQRDAGNGAMTVYGKGLGSIFVLQGKENGRPLLDRRTLRLPQVNIDGHTGTELATPLGTIVTFERDGVSYLVGGLVPPVAAENAARDLR
jgi:outer membrane lipoprotein-sorting protein